MNVDLDNDIDRLYVAPREEFVRERDALVRTLRAAGDRDAAAEVGALRKPTLVAWTVNQLAHKERRDIDLLLDAGKRIIDAQESSIAKGGRADLDAAQASLRRAISGLTAQASAILGPEASKTTLDPRRGDAAHRRDSTRRPGAPRARSAERGAERDRLGDRRGLRPVAAREVEARRQAGRRAGRHRRRSARPRSRPRPGGCAS